MENIDRLLVILTEHKVIILSILAFLVVGRYRVARWRSSGMRKVVNAHQNILDDLTERINIIREDRDSTLERLSQERAKGFIAHERIQVLEQKVGTLETQIETLERQKQELLLRINEQK
jgi:chromosome segregation ATPase